MAGKPMKILIVVPGGVSSPKDLLAEAAKGTGMGYQIITETNYADAAKLIREKGNEFTFIVAGEGSRDQKASFVNDLLPAIKEAGVSNRTRLIYFGMLDKIDSMRGDLIKMGIKIFDQTKLETDDLFSMNPKGFEVI